jgi:hypothetical protein
MRRPFSLVIGVLMIALGAYVALRPLLGDGRPVTSARWLDLAFAAIFLLRGTMYLRAARRLGRPGEPPHP